MSESAEMEPQEALGTQPIKVHPFAVGIVEDRPLEEYLAGPEVSSGKLVAFEKAPALVYGQEAEENETPAMARGTLIHCAILEPDEVERRFFRSELAVFNARHNAYKEEVARAGGRTLAKAADYDNALRMRDGLFRNRVAREVLVGSRTEVTAYWRHAPTSLECRCRPDIVNDEREILADLKTTGCAAQFDFERTARRMRYGMKAAWIADGWFEAGGFDPAAFLIFAWEPKPPFLCATYEISPASLNQSRDDIEDLMERWKTCQATNEWPGYPDTIQSLDLTRRKI